MNETRFPGRWLAGLSLILGPILMLSGVLLRLGPDFFYPTQIWGYASQPARMTTAYSLFLLGDLLLLPGVVALSQRISASRPLRALAGGAMVTFGLMARAFHAGMDAMAFRLVDVLGAEGATRVVADSYTTPHVVTAFNVAIMLGWIVLAVGAWRSRALGLLGSVALALTAALPLGVLKGTSPMSIVAVAGLTVALVPFGLRILCEGDRPSFTQAAKWTVIVVAGVVAMALLGLAG